MTAIRSGVALAAGVLVASCSTPADVPGRDGVPMPDGIEMVTLDVDRTVIAEGFTLVKSE